MDPLTPANADARRWLLVVTAILAVSAALATARPPSGPLQAAPCDVALRLDGALRCEERGVTLAALCGGGPEVDLRSGDAVERALACPARPPRRGGAGWGRMTPADLAILEVPIVVNEASLEELDTLPGIGPVLARRIIEGRPYGELTELRRVPGIGPKKLARLRARARTRW